MLVPDRSCTNRLYEKECNAYSKVIYDNLHHPYNNAACEACGDDDKAGDGIHRCVLRFSTFSNQFVKLFDFKGISLMRPTHACEAFPNKAQSGDHCSVERCQAGFQAHDDMCMSRATAHVCFRHEQNRHNSDFLIANLFQSTIIIHYKSATKRESLFPKWFSQQKSTPCKTYPCCTPVFYLGDCSLIPFNVLFSILTLLLLEKSRQTW